MAKIALVYPAPKKSIGGIIVDAFISEEHSFTNNVTDIPIEDGAVVTDNIVPAPDELQISGFIGRYALQLPVLRTTKQAFLELKKLKEDRLPINIVTGLDVYPNMVLTSLSIPRDASTGFDLHFSASFRKLSIIRTKTVAISVSNAPKTSATDQIQSTGTSGVQAKKSVGTEDPLLKQWCKDEVKKGNLSIADYEAQFGEPFIK